MGVRLIVEILDHWQDADLTPGERWDLLVLAENANDGSRLTFGPVHAPHILQRANKSPKGWKNAITALMRKKVITTHVPGRINQCAVYHLEHLCPEPPHSGYKGLCTKPTAEAAATDPLPQGNGSVAQEEGHLSGDPLDGDPQEGHPVGDPEGHPTDDPLGQEGHPADAERVIQQVTPTPLLSSFKDSPRTTSSSSVAEDSKEGPVSSSDGSEGGGGGESISLEEITEQAERAEAFVDSLSYRGRQPGKKQRQKIAQRVVAAFKDGWTESGLRRYLDISDDPTVRSPASVYLHRLSDDELPDGALGESPQLPPACWTCLGISPTAATDVNIRVNPITGDPCPSCHPATVGQSPEVPPACAACLEENPAARTNPRMRYRIVDGAHQACPDCNPKRIAILAAQNAQRDGTDGDIWGRAERRLETGDWRGAGPDERAVGWLALGKKLAPAAQRSSAAVRTGRRYDNSIWREPADPVLAAKIPHCGAPECDPITRLKTERDWTGDQHTAICGDCHPAMKFG